VAFRITRAMSVVFLGGPRLLNINKGFKVFKILNKFNSENKL